MALAPPVVAKVTNTAEVNTTVAEESVSEEKKPMRRNTVHRKKNMTDDEIMAIVGQFHWSFKWHLLDLKRIV